MVPSRSIVQPARIAHGASVRDLVALAKPRVTSLVLFTTAGGAWLANARISAVPMAFLMVGTLLIVAGANALNMLLERDTDALMARTKDRPLAAGRLSPAVALWFGVGASVAALPLLAFGVNPTTAVLAALANLLYVLAYTPLKRRTHLALLVGAVPGAIPPLLGWTAATGRVEAAGLMLFAVLYFWQLPHFHAIALSRREEYERAGLWVMPTARGTAATWRAIAISIFLLVASSVLLVPLHVVRPSHLPVPLALGAGLWIVAAIEARRGRGGRATFLASLVYLVALFASLAASAGG